MQQDYFHESVLLPEVMQYLHLHEGSVGVDVTAGGGGHLTEIAKTVGSTGRVIALDRDLRAHGQDAAGKVAQVHLHHVSFAHLPQVLAKEGIEKVDGLLCDLGVSSVQLDDDARGFSFMRDGPIDMRMDTSSGLTAYELITQSSERELADILYIYGEEYKSRRIARAIHAAWPIPDSTLHLANLVARAAGGKRGRIHPATKTFQALRIATNRELDELKTLLDALPQILAVNGRAVFISFHSLEDRLVKHAFKEGSSRTETRGPLWRILTKKPVIAGDIELARNPRARSAKLRAVEMLPRE